MQYPARPAFSRVGKACGNSHALQVLQGVGDFLVCRTGGLLVLALDCDRLLVLSSDNEHIDLAGFANDGFSKRHFCIYIEPLAAEVGQDVPSDQVAIVVPGHDVRVSLEILGAVPIVPALPGKHMEFQARRGEGVGWVPVTEAQRSMGFQGSVW